MRACVSVCVCVCVCVRSRHNTQVVVYISLLYNKRHETARKKVLCYNRKPVNVSSSEYGFVIRHLQSARNEKKSFFLGSHQRRGNGAEAPPRPDPALCVQLIGEIYSVK